MKELKGTKTERNLMEAFAGESQARNKYTFYDLRLAKTATSRLPLSLRKLLPMKKSTPNCGSSFFTTVRCPTP